MYAFEWKLWQRKSTIEHEAVICACGLIAEGCVCQGIITGRPTSVYNRLAKFPLWWRSAPQSPKYPDEKVTGTSRNESILTGRWDGLAYSASRFNFLMSAFMHVLLSGYDWSSNWSVRACHAHMLSQTNKVWLFNQIHIEYCNSWDCVLSLVWVVAVVSVYSSMTSVVED